MPTEPAVAWELQADLGEGPVWVERDRALWFTDIKGKRIHRFDPSSGTHQSWDSPEQVGFVVPAASGGFIAGLKSGLFRFDPESGAFELLVEVEPELPSNRLNDATVDARGRLWFGTMDDGESRPSGAYYRFERGELRPTGIGGIRITNGPALSPDGRTLYIVDTVGRTVSACAVGEEGEVGKPLEIIRIAEGEGNPDGPTVDSEGCIWIGLYGGWEARRYSPAGELLDRVRFPVANVTKVAFGGPGLSTAYATSARHLLSPEDLDRQPLAGSLFYFDVDVPGLPCPPVAD